MTQSKRKNQCLWTTRAKTLRVPWLSGGYRKMSLLTDGLFFVDDRGKTVIAKPKDTAFGRAEEQEILREAVEVAGWVAVFADPALG